MTPLLGFTPDADPLTPGVMTDCTNVIPYAAGMQAAPTMISTGTPALVSECQGASVLTKLNDQRRIIAGTASNLYELVAGAWVNVSRSGGYVSGGNARWTLCQFGDTTLAANGNDTIQRSVGSGAFANIASAPKARIIFSVGAFVMALNVDDGDLKPDGWANCASFDDTDWTPNVATLANSGRLVSTTGAITAGGSLGEYAVAYKKDAIYVGQFVGAPATFDWVQAPGGNAGCVGQDAWCDVNGLHFIVGMDNFWLFDGSRPAPLGDGQVRQWFFNNCNPAYLYKTQCVFDQQNNLIWVYYASKTSDKLDTALVYHVLSKQWGKVSINVQSVLTFVQPSASYDTLTTYASTYDTLPDAPYDSQFWLSGGRSLAVFDTAHTLRSLTGQGGTGTFTTGDLGDDDEVTALNKVRIRFQQNPTSASVVTLGKMNEGDDMTASASQPMVNGQFDVRQSARFHRGVFTLVGDCKFNALRPTITPAGAR